MVLTIFRNRCERLLTQADLKKQVCVSASSDSQVFKKTQLKLLPMIKGRWVLAVVSGVGGLSSFSVHFLCLSKVNEPKERTLLRRNFYCIAFRKTSVETSPSHLWRDEFQSKLSRPILRKRNQTVNWLCSKEWFKNQKAPILTSLRSR